MSCSDITVTQAKILLPPIERIYLFLKSLKTRVEQQNFGSKKHNQNADQTPFFARNARHEAVAINRHNNIITSST